jgi:hypothetical protein
MSDLSLIPTKQLIDEFRRRFDHFVFMGQLDKGEQSEVLHAEHGCQLMCNWMVDDLKELVRHGDGEEEAGAES